jgi:hypothetical protein
MSGDIRNNIVMRRYNIIEDDIILRPLEAIPLLYCIDVLFRWEYMIKRINFLNSI